VARRSMRRVCRVLKFPVPGWRRARVIAAAPPRLDEVLAERIQRLIQGIRLSVTGDMAMLRFVEGDRVNLKAVYRLLMLKGWFVHQRSLTPRPASTDSGVVRSAATNGGTGCNAHSMWS